MSLTQQSNTPGPPRPGRADRPDRKPHGRLAFNIDPRKSPEGVRPNAEQKVRGKARGQHDRSGRTRCSDRERLEREERR